MASGCVKILVSAYLVVFLIGGGRVCGCEVLSWAGIDVHGAGHEHCSHHHDHFEHEHEHEEVAAGHHGHEPFPVEGKDCCEQSLKTFDGDVPRTLALPVIIPVDLEKFFVEFEQGMDSPKEPAGHRMRAPPPWSGPPAPSCSETLATCQRYNV